MEPLGLLTSFFLGIRHCLEPDHLAAMAQFGTAARAPRQGLRAGLLWGAGHGAAVLALVALFSGAQAWLLPFEAAAERAVGVTLIVLAVWRLRALLRKPHEHEHRHANGVVHSHEHTHDREHAHLHAPTLTGLIHGTAGSMGLITLLSVGRSPLILAAAFSLGALLAMGAAGWGAARFYESASVRGLERLAVGTTGAAGLVLGVVWLVKA
jgi:ABC-type nickel/cobalt efflux system permease component RcnA